MKSRTIIPGGSHGTTTRAQRLHKRCGTSGRAVARLLAFVLLGFLGACAYSYVDSDGTRHIIGLVNMRIEPTENSKTFAGEVFDITSVGVSYYSANDNTSFTVGYSRNVTAALRDNALVLGNPLAAAKVDISE